MPSREKVKSALRMVSTNYRRHLWRNQLAAKIYRFATAVEKSGVLFADEKAMVREFKEILKVRTDTVQVFLNYIQRTRRRRPNRPLP